MGDLFGPYLIGKERLEDGILSADEQEITKEQKKGGKNKRSLRYAGLADQFSAKMGKKKRISVESNTNVIFTGMIVLPGEEQRWEVWLHEQCAIWAAGVYMAGKYRERNAKIEQGSGTGERRLGGDYSKIGDYAYRWQSDGTAGSSMGLHKVDMLFLRFDRRKHWLRDTWL